MNILLLVGSVFLIAPGQGPLAPIQGQEVERVVIRAPMTAEDGGRTEVTLTDPRDVDRIVRALSDMTRRSMDHSSPDFDLEFATRNGGSLTLRLSAFEVGPDAAASAYVPHWFPRDPDAFAKLHRYLMEKLKAGR